MPQKYVLLPSVLARSVARIRHFATAPARAHTPDIPEREAESSSTAQKRYREQQDMRLKSRQDISHRAATMVIAALASDRELVARREKGKERAVEDISPLLPSSFPPILSRLLSARLYRLAAFHTIGNPVLIQDKHLVHSLVQHLEYHGCAKLATRLKIGAENIGPDGKARLACLPRGTVGKGSQGKENETLSEEVDGSRKSPPPLPPALPKNGISQKSVNTYYNSFLIHLCTHTDISISIPIPLFSPTSDMDSVSGRDTIQWTLPPPSPDLLQVKSLMEVIVAFQERGFKPDRVTISIIIRSWLRCARIRHQSLIDPDLNPPHRYISSRDIIVLFRLISTHLSSFPPPPFGARQEREHEWDHVIRPLGKAVIRTLRTVHGPISKAATEAFSEGSTADEMDIVAIEKRYTRARREIKEVSDWMKSRKEELLGKGKDFL